VKVSEKVEPSAQKSHREKSGEPKQYRPRFKLAEAWREVGLEELKVAETMAGLNRLTGKENGEFTRAIKII
jgi:hypothetical protein